MISGLLAASEPFMYTFDFDLRLTTQIRKSNFLLFAAAHVGGNSKNVERQ